AIPRRYGSRAVCAAPTRAESGHATAPPYRPGAGRNPRTGSAGQVGDLDELGDVDAVPGQLGDAARVGDVVAVVADPQDGAAVQADRFDFPAVCANPTGHAGRVRNRR